MDLNTPLTQTSKVGPYIHRKLKKLNLETIGDLLYHFPFRYENLGKSKKICDIRVGETSSIIGTILQIHNIRTRYGKYLTLATINDRTASIETVWFNQPFLTKTILVGTKISLAGKVDLFSNKESFINPDYEIADTKKSSKLLHTQGLVPVYPETAGISSRWFRIKIGELLPTLLPKIEETLPLDTIKRNKLINIRQALRVIHSPKNEIQIEKAKKRLSFDELLAVLIQVLARKETWHKNQTVTKLSIFQEDILKLISALPFELTNSQKGVLKDILNDFSKDKPMNRLLQGDVGSGKTVVAALAAYNVILNGYQVAFMAPTEILAIQHYNTIKSILSAYNIKIAIRTAGKKEGDAAFDIIVGTHALLSKGVIFKNLAFVIVDEQHRFGVTQRALLRNKGVSAHVLTMTATPIPRSLALTFYGDLDISVIDMLPSGRLPVKTYVVPPEKRNTAYQFIGKHISEGEQAFIICPLIEPSETLSSAKAATAEYERLKKEIFPDLAMGLLHGRLKSKEKEQILNNFLSKKIDILVATPVVEVGLDIPNATIMMIEATERFGLASLHQLRGRVGRRSMQSYCLLFTESNSPSVINRLKALEKYHIGLKLAELDLQMRGPGNLYGTAQAGLPNFKIANINNLKLIETVKKEANIIYGNKLYKKIPYLASIINNQAFVAAD